MATVLGEIPKYKAIYAFVYPLAHNLIISSSRFVSRGMLSSDISHLPLSNASAARRCRPRTRLAQSLSPIFAPTAARRSRSAGRGLRCNLPIVAV